VTALVLYVTLSAAAYYLVARAKITEALWSRYPPALEYWALCAACSGFAYGVVAALVVGRPLGLDFLGLDGRTWYTPLAAGLASMVWTPVLARAMVIGWMDLAGDDEP
jgi:hypothetical protein